MIKPYLFPYNTRRFSHNHQNSDNILWVNTRLQWDTTEGNAVISFSWSYFLFVITFVALFISSPVYRVFIANKFLRKLSFTFNVWVWIPVHFCPSLFPSSNNHLSDDQKHNHHFHRSLRSSLHGYDGTRGANTVTPFLMIWWSLSFCPIDSRQIDILSFVFEDKIILSIRPFEIHQYCWTQNSE